jgi:translation elongation factor EF-Ts
MHKIRRTEHYIPQFSVAVTKYLRKSIGEEEKLISSFASEVSAHGHLPLLPLDLW